MKRKKILVSRGKSYAWVSGEDYTYLMQWKWHDGNGYARRYARANEAEGRKGNSIYMHRVVLERKLGHPIPDDLIPDHLDRDKSNNTRQNLRAVTRRENNFNCAQYDRFKHAKTFKRIGVRYSA